MSATPQPLRAPAPFDSTSMTSPAPGWRSHYTLLILLFVYTMSCIDRQIISILIQPIKDEFHVSDTAMGVLTGLTFAFFYTGLAIPIGRYADRSNRRNVVALACAAWSAMTVLCGMAVGYWSLALARIGIAVGEAGGGAPSMSMIADHYPPEKRGRAMGVYALGPQLGVLLGLTIGGLIAQHQGWRAAFLWMGLPGLLAAALLRFTGTEPRRGQWEPARAVALAAEPLRTVLRDLWASPAFVRVTAGTMLMAFGGYGIGIWTPSFLVRSHGMSLQGAGAVMGLLGGLMAAFGSVLSGWLADTLARRDERWRIGVPVLGCLLSVPTGLAFYLLPAGSPWMLGQFAVPRAIGFYMLFAITAAWWVAPVYAVMADIVVPHRRATAMAIFNMSVALFGAGFGPLFVGTLSDRLVPAFGNESLRWALAGTTVVCYAVGLFVYASALRPYARLKRSAPEAS